MSVHGREWTYCAYSGACLVDLLCAATPPCACHATSLSILFPSAVQWIDPSIPPTPPPPRKFASAGIISSPDGDSMFGEPTCSVRLGNTALTRTQLSDFLRSSRSRFMARNFSLRNHTSIDFADTVASFLTGQGVPGEVTVPIQLMVVDGEEVLLHANQDTGQLFSSPTPRDLLSASHPSTVASICLGVIEGLVSESNRIESFDSTRSLSTCCPMRISCRDRVSTQNTPETVSFRVPPRLLSPSNQPRLSGVTFRLSTRPCLCGTLRQK